MKTIAGVFAGMIWAFAFNYTENHYSPSLLITITIVVIAVIVMGSVYEYIERYPDE